MATFMLVTGVILLSAGIVMAFRLPSSAAMLSYAALIAIWYSGYSSGLTQRGLLFWAIAVIIICGIGMAGGGDALRGLPLARYYTVGGALAGMLAAIAAGQSVMILGAAAGAFIGAIAWSRTPAGRTHRNDIWKITVASGIPATVTMTIAGTVIRQLTMFN